jgi:hypothetical protein
LSIVFEKKILFFSQKHEFADANIGGIEKVDFFEKEKNTGGFLTNPPVL